MTKTLENSCVISGIGRSVSGRKLDRDPWDLTLDAALAAIADAGLPVSAIDGLSTYPGAVGSTPGITGAGTGDVRTMLGITTRWHTGGMEMPGQLGSVINAMAAVHAGLAEHVLCFRTVWEASAQRQMGGRSKAVGSSAMRERTQWADPYGFGYPNHGALLMQRYMSESGTTREQLAQLSVTQRANAQLNPHGVFPELLTVADYMNAKMISDPLCLLDCDIPIDGSVACVVSRADSPLIDRNRSIGFEAVGSSVGFENCADMMWSRTDLSPSDVDIAQLYDGFSILAILWMEALGLCGKNEAGRFLEGGKRIVRDGELPVNTDGGQLSAGRMHGFGAFYEACVQLRGDAGERQVPGDPKLAVVSAGAADFTSCVLLSKGNY
jgi:acetyl-CoA acetyltransferase